MPRPVGLHPECRVEVELGCAEGQFAFELASAHPDWFVAGLEIREKLVVRNNGRAAREGRTNLRFGYVNMNVDLDRVFEERSVDRFHLLFPDPWFKRRHQKRRVLDVSLCRVLRAQLREGGELHVASDVFEVALDAMSNLEDPEVQALGFRNLRGAWSFAREAPCAVTSRREETTRERGQRVWRLRYGVGAPVAGDSGES
ncbi:MAG: tRNA (guanine(46)-N(7))-methyltransferase TrmB [Planctomycetota bacterium]